MTEHLRLSGGVAMNTEHVREEPDASGCICPQDFVRPDCPVHGRRMSMIDRLSRFVERAYPWVIWLAVLVVILAILGTATEGWH